MARSTYVYVVLLAEDNLPVAAFTVKHELKTWIEMRPSEKYRIFRVRDGRWQEPEQRTEMFYPFE